MRPFLILLVLLVMLPLSVKAEDLGNLSLNRFHPDSLTNPFGAGNRFAPNSLTNPYSEYGSPFSNKSWSNPYAMEAPKLFDQQGNYRGRLSTNPYDPDSITNPYGRYGSRFSPDSLNISFGAGDPYRPDSPFNPFGEGWRVEGQ